MQEKKLQGNVPAKKPASFNADILKSKKRVLSEEEQHRLNNMLWDAAEKGKTKRVERLLNVGANIEAAFISNWTALMYAAAYGHTPTCALLIEKGADMNMKAEKGDNRGMTAYSIAEKNGKNKTVAFFELMADMEPIQRTAFLSSFRECVAA